MLTWLIFAGPVTNVKVYGVLTYIAVLSLPACIIVILMIVSYAGSTQLCPYDGATLTLSGGTVLTCPPAELTCSRNTPIITLSSTSNLPPSCEYICIINYLYLIII